jgi:acetyl-CoA C-acetyltransferase
MSDALIIDAVRTPIGRKGGTLAGAHSAELLGTVQAAVVERSGVDPATVSQVFGGCIAQVGMQAFNLTRTAWLTAGLPMTVPATTMDTQCGSSQAAVNTASTFIQAGAADLAVACGVEIMSRVPLGSSLGQGLGKQVTRAYFRHHEYTSQFEAAERIADAWGITRDDAESFAVESQRRAARAWDEGRFDTQVLTVDAPVLGDDGKPTGDTVRFERDETFRPTTLEGLRNLKPVARPDGVHTAGTSSQIADAAAALLLASEARADALGLEPMARIVDSCLVAGDPVLMLTGPIEATRLLLERNKLTVDDVDVFENNEAFASVVLAWFREHRADPTRVNANGGAIALGHALGSTGTVLVTKAVHELQRTGGRYALVTMCCGGGLATGTLIERV